MQNKEIIFKCRECGEIRSNLGALHSHVERNHRSPWSMPGRKDELMEFTQVLEIKQTQEIELEDFEEYPSRNGLVDYFTGIVGLKT